MHPRTGIKSNSLPRCVGMLLECWNLRRFHFHLNIICCCSSDKCYDFKCQIWSETEFIVAFNRSTAPRHSLSVSDLTYSLTSLEFQMFLVVESIKLCLEIQFHSFFFSNPKAQQRVWISSFSCKFEFKLNRALSLNFQTYWFMADIC